MFKFVNYRSLTRVVDVTVQLLRIVSMKHDLLLNQILNGPLCHRILVVVGPIVNI